MEGSERRDQSGGIRAKGSEWRDPSGGIRVEEYERRDPNGEIRGNGFEWRDPSVWILAEERRDMSGRVPGERIRMEGSVRTADGSKLNDLS